MTKRHLKSNKAPKSWAIHRKAQKYAMRPNPGAHGLELGMPISLLLKRLHHANTTKECRNILYTHDVLVDGRRVKDTKFMVGFMDVVSFPALKEHYRVCLDGKGRLVYNKISEKDAAFNAYKIRKKTMLKGGRLQLNCSSNINLIVDKDEYKVGDTVLLSIPNKKIQKHLKFENGASVVLTKGSHVGKTGVVEDIRDGILVYKNSEGNMG